MAELKELDSIELLNIIKDEYECGYCNKCRAHRRQGVTHEGSIVECRTAGKNAIKVFWKDMKPTRNLKRQKNLKRLFLRLTRFITRL